MSRSRRLANDGDASMIIHVDIDNTIVDIFYYFEKTNKVRPRKPTYGLEERYYPGATNDMLRWLDEGRDELVIDGAFETIDALVAAGHVVWIVTVRTAKARERFREKYPAYASLVRPKRDIIDGGERCDVLIDDHPMEEHVALAGRVYIVDRDYNTAYMPSFQRLASLPDVLDIMPVF